MKKKIKSILAVVMAFAMVTALCASTAFAASVGTADEDYDGSDNDAIVVGSFGREAAAPRYTSYYNEDMSGITLTDDYSWHNGVIYDTAGSYTIIGTTIIMDTDADGSDTNDFSGLGAAVMAVGSDVTLTIENSYIETTGVAKLALFTDNGAVSIVKSSTLIANGGVIYDGYYSTADQSMMVSPPWVLGLGGAADEGVNARTTNIMGNYSVGVYIDSYFEAAGWGVLSTDSGTNMMMVVINSEVVIENSGYGAYAIGECTEEYYGTTMDVSTYAIIMCGAEATFQSYTAGQLVTVLQNTGETDVYGMGTNGTKVTTVYSSEAEGTVYSEITSDNFGFMCHANGSTGYNIVNILDGTTVTSTDAVFLVKKINAIITVDNSTIESTEKGVLLQIIDNDDDYVGVDATLEWGFDDNYGHSYGTHMPSFNTTFHEDDGYSNEWIASTAAAALLAAGEYDTSDNWTVDFTITNTDAEGDIWNSTGYVGSNVATTLTVTIGEGATLTGLIAAGAFAHDTKDATVGDGDWSGATALGHVTNIVNSNGVNIVNVVLEDGGVWTVTEDSCIDTIKVDADSTLVLSAGTSITIGDVTITAAGDADEEYSAEDLEEEGVDVSGDTDDTDTDDTDTDDTDDTDDTTDDEDAAAVGDSFNMTLWLALAALAVCGGCVLVVRRRFN